ncbi:acyl carrier protein [Streptacidiphilus sp. PAMC 29251]
METASDIVEGTVRGILSAEILVDFAEDEFGLDDGLQDMFGIDSVGLIELRIRCEDVFGLEIAEEHFSPENFASLRSVVALVRRLLRGAGDRRAA